MNRINYIFDQLKSQNRKALIPYITAGDPLADITVPLMHTLVEAGANIIELGIPFSDPMAEGPVIQVAHERALQQGITLVDVMTIVKKFRELDVSTPVVLMGYLNPVETTGYAKFAEMAQQAGVDGLIIVDLPIEEADELLNELNKCNIALIFLITPTTTQERLKLICQKSSGYHYYVSLKGVTGSSQFNVTEVTDKLLVIRQLAKLPIAVGFGIRDAQSAAAVAQVAEGVIVGSALVAHIASAGKKRQQIEQAARELIAGMRLAMDTC